jgi:hypothetical protein
MCRYDGETRHDARPESARDGKPVTADALRQALASGATLQVHQPHRYSTPALRLVAALEERFGCLVGVNAYITPSGSQVGVVCPGEEEGLHAWGSWVHFFFFSSFIGYSLVD